MVPQRSGIEPEEIQGAVHIRFPSLFNECWLYVNGEEVAHHKQGQLWWLNDYRFEWDVDRQINSKQAGF